MDSMWIAVDAASGDHGYEPMVSGAAQAVRDLGLKVILVGNEELIEKELEKYSDIHNNIQIEHAEEVIGMDDQPARAIRTKKTSSIVVAANLVKAKKAVGFFSPGNTGASMAAALMILGRLQGVKRPVIMTPIPRKGQTTTVLVDGGANVDSKPEVLFQSAIMGEIYAREILGIIHPRVGILSNGEEEGKGNELTQGVYSMLKKLPFNFVGNVEGRDIFGFGKEVDVVVTDGFTGNIVIKTIEGTAKAIFNILKTNIKESGLAKTGALLLKPTLQAVKAQMDHSNYGGAPLLGVDGIVIIGHGSSNAWAVRNAIKVTAEFARHNLNNLIVQEIDKYL